jgi:hypothetical protein
MTAILVVVRRMLVHKWLSRSHLVAGKHPTVQFSPFVLRILLFLTAINSDQIINLQLELAVLFLLSCESKSDVH